jgi:membrane protease YdiL (CAAX protease family)
MATTSSPHQSTQPVVRASRPPQDPHDLSWSDEWPRPALSAGEVTYRWIEYFSLFFIVPFFISLRTVNVPFLALLGAGFIGCLVMLLRDRSFDRTLLWNLPGFKRAVLPIAGLYAVAVVAVGSGVYFLRPDLFLSFPRERTALWAMVMFLYPIVSVYPQNIIYRAFIFHRYRGLIGDPRLLVVLSAVAFCWGHIVFQNVLALVLTLAGGVIFAATYYRTRSLLASSFEHALYGCLIFTVGLGKSLYFAAVSAR